MLPCVTAVATGWLPGKHHGYFKLNQNLIIARQFYDKKGVLTGTRTLSNYTTSLYVEYGLTDRVAFTGYFPFFVRNTLNRTRGKLSGRILEPGAVNNGIGDQDIGLRFRLYQDDQWVFSLLGLLGIPAGEAGDENGLITGDGEFNKQVLLEFGLSVSKSFYIAGSAGFNNRTGGFSDEFLYSFEAGDAYGITLSSFTALKGRNIFGAPSWNLGIYYEL